jgi:WD40 repeat protein/transcriptional regulator with XRE-family HTH domain
MTTHQQQPAETFRGLLLRHRGRTQLTQRELAARIGVSRGSVQDWEAGINYPTAQRLQVVIEAFFEAGGLTARREALEARELWAAAERESPRLRTPFDEEWFTRLLAAHTAATPERSTGALRAVPTTGLGQGAVERAQDWGEAPDTFDFVGRDDELALLRRWVLAERSRLVAVLGMGGIGKTSLAAKLAHEVGPSFERAYWRSMRNAPAPEEWFRGAIGFLSDNQLIPPDHETEQLAVLLELLDKRSCLLVMDNMETVLEPGRPEGAYREGYAAYGRVQQVVAEGKHRSCLVMTSREAPPELAFAGGVPLVRKLELGPLGVREGQTLLRDKALAGDEQDWADLVERTGGNGLALKIFGESIRQLFGGDIGAFFEAFSAAPIFGGIRRLLDEQVVRSSPLEMEALTHLAIAREPVAVSDLLATLGETTGRRGPVVETIESLRRRSLVEPSQSGRSFTLQSVVLEYITDRLVEQVSDEIQQTRPNALVRHALITATGSDYIRRTQEQLIGEAILKRAPSDIGARQIERLLIDLLKMWRGGDASQVGYGPGNAINLLRLSRKNLAGLDFSDLFVRQAYLQEVDAQDTNLAGAELRQTVLAGAFDAVNAVALSADGSIVAAGTMGGEVRAWRVADRMPLVSINGHAGQVGGVALSADGRLLASGGHDRVVRIWSVDDGRPIASLEGHAAAVTGVAMSRGGRTVVSSSFDGTVRCWDAEHRSLIATFRDRSGGVISVALSADGRRVVSGGTDGTVTLWDMERRQAERRLEGHQGGVVRVAITDDGQTIAACSRDGSVRIWDASGRLLTLLDRHAGGVYGVALSADGAAVAGGGFDGTLRLSAAADGAPLATQQGHSGAIMAVAFAGEGQIVASGSLDGTVRLWRVDGGRPLATLEGQTGSVMTVAMTTDNGIVASGSFDGAIRLWHAETGGLEPALRGHRGVIYGVALSANGRIIASSGNDATVRVWDAPNHRQLAVLQGHAAAVGGVAISPDGKTVASGGLDGTVRVWPTATHRSAVIIQSGSGSVYSVAIADDGRLLAAGGVDAAVRLWETATGRLVSTFVGHASAINGVALSSDGLWLVTGSHDGTVRLWDTRSAKLQVILQGHTGGIYGVAISPDARFIASCGQDAMVRLWEAPNGHSRAILEGHVGAVRGIAFSLGGRILASGGLDGTIKLWDSTTCSPVRTLRPDRRYERMDITGLRGITEAQRTVLYSLGAVSRSPAATQ